MKVKVEIRMCFLVFLCVFYFGLTTYSPAYVADICGAVCISLIVVFSGMNVMMCKSL